MGQQPGLPGDCKQGDEKKEKKYEPSRAALPRTPVGGDGAAAGWGVRRRAEYGAGEGHA
jgi:hypothetical protein